MLYLRKTKNKSSFGRKVFKIVILITILIVLNFLTNGGMKNMATKTMGLIWINEKNITNNSHMIADNLKSKKTLIEELKQLRTALENEKASNHLKTLYWETRYDDLKKIKNLTNKDATETIKTALVIAKPPQTARNSIAVDFDPSYLNKLNRIYSENFIIASIEKTNHWPIIIPLYGQDKEKIKFLVGPKKIPISAIGQGGGSFKAYLPVDTEIKQNQPIYLNNGFAELFGYISNVEKSKDGNKLIIYFRSPININELRSVQIK